jgi:hypothetical protein
MDNELAALTSVTGGNADIPQPGRQAADDPGCVKTYTAKTLSGHQLGQLAT